MYSCDKSADLVFGNFDRHFRAIGLGKPRLVLESGWHGAVAGFMGVAEFVKVEQFRRQRFAAGMPLTFVLVDVYFQLSGHFSRSLAVASARLVFPMIIAMREPSASVQIAT
jgi:hypothetical protein